jgi:hypothetical protein
MPSPTTLVINSKTLGLTRYKAGNKVWIVKLDQFGRPFVKGTIIDDNFRPSDFYKVQCTVKDGPSSKPTPIGLQILLGEMLIVEGLTREDERVVTTAVHEAHLLHASLSVMDAVGIGYTAFTHYPVNEGEIAAIRPGTPHGQFCTDAEVKIVDLIARCNERT